MEKCELEMSFAELKILRSLAMDKVIGDSPSEVSTVKLLVNMPVHYRAA